LLAAVHHLDHAIGEIVAALERSGQRDDTLILFSSDNGPQGSWSGDAYPDDLKLTDFNQPLPFRGKKTDVWEGGIHVPAFANWPGRIAPHDVAAPTHIIDFFPTLAALLGAKTLPQVEWYGIDITPVLFSDGALPRRELYWTWNRRSNRWALRHGNWKIVKYGTGAPSSPGEWQLFDLKSDPREQSNVAAQNQEVVENLHQLFIQQRSNDRL